jgi:hypothetical protein
VVYRITWETRTLNPFGEPLKGFAGGAGNWSHKLVSTAPADGLLFPFTSFQGNESAFRLAAEEYIEVGTKDKQVAAVKYQYLIVRFTCYVLIR